MKYSMIKDGFINIYKLLLCNYKELGLTENEFVVLSFLFILKEKNKHCISLGAIAQKTNLKTNEVGEIIDSLINKYFITIEVEIDKNGKSRETFDLEECFKRITSLLNKANQSSLIGDLIDLFEKEVGRTLSPMELEVVNQWSDIYTFEEVKNALLEAVKLGKINLKYVDTILLNQKNKNKTLEKDNEALFTSNLDENKRETINQLFDMVKR